MTKLKKEKLTERGWKVLLNFIAGKVDMKELYGFRVFITDKNGKVVKK